MKSIHNYIVHIENKHVEEIETKSGLVLQKHLGISQGFDFTREGTIVCESTRGCNDIKEGDTVYFHHHIAMEEIGFDGNRMESDYLFDVDKGWYSVPVGMVYGYSREDKFTPIDGWCFLEPTINNKINPDKYPHIIIPNNEVEAVSVGIIKYGCPQLYEIGIKEGDAVYFSDNSKYPMKILGEDMWRMNVDWILAKA